jgi:hypothetical protein
MPVKCAQKSAADVHEVAAGVHGCNPHPLEKTPDWEVWHRAIEMPRVTAAGVHGYNPHFQ